MRGNNIMGIIFSNLHEDLISEITDRRTMGAVPFGGKYRLIDFPLSNMVNSGINKIGVLTKSNYQSLIDHLGTGKAWDLSRKRDGLFILPPFTNTSEYSNRMTTLNSIMPFLKNSTEEYVVISDCDTVCNIDYQKVCNKHLENGADITLVYKHGQIPAKLHDPTVFSLDSRGRIIDVLSGAVHVLDGNMQKISNSIFVVVPYNYELSSTVEEEAKGPVSWLKGN